MLVEPRTDLRELLGGTLNRIAVRVAGLVCHSDRPSVGVCVRSESLREGEARACQVVGLHVAGSALATALVGWRWASATSARAKSVSAIYGGPRPPFRD